MMTALILLPAAAVVVAWFVLRFKATEAVFDVLTSDERYHEQALAKPAPAPVVTFVPDGFTCLGCRELPALPGEVWCAVCTPVSVFTPMPWEPTERGPR